METMSFFTKFKGHSFGSSNQKLKSQKIVVIKKIPFKSYSAQVKGKDISKEIYIYNFIFCHRCSSSFVGNRV